MARYRRSKTDNRLFEDIPKVKNKKRYNKRKLPLKSNEEKIED